MKSRLFFLLSYFLIVVYATAQDEAPLNSSFLAENGISYKVLDAAASELLQEGSFINNIDISIQSLEVNRNFKTQVIYDPNYKEGKDIRFVVAKGEFSKKELRALEKSIEKSHKLSRLSRRGLYDESSLSFISETDGESIFGFIYSKDDIEPELKDIKKYEGKIFVKNGTLTKVELTSDKPLSGRKQSFKRIVSNKTRVWTTTSSWCERSFTFAR